MKKFILIFSMFCSIILYADLFDNAINEEQKGNVKIVTELYLVSCNSENSKGCKQFRAGVK